MLECRWGIYSSFRKMYRSPFSALQEVTHSANGLVDTFFILLQFKRHALIFFGRSRIDLLIIPFAARIIKLVALHLIRPFKM